MRCDNAQAEEISTHSIYPNEWDEKILEKYNDDKKGDSKWSDPKPKEIEKKKSKSKKPKPEPDSD